MFPRHALYVPSTCSIFQQNQKNGAFVDRQLYLTDRLLGFSHIGQDIMLDCIDLAEIEPDLVHVINDQIDEMIDSAAGDSRLR